MDVKNHLKIFYNDFVLAKSNTITNLNNMYTNAIMMSNKWNPFMEYCINNLHKFSKPNIFYGKHLQVMTSTGALFISGRLYEITEQNMYVIEKKEFAGNCNICNTNQNTCNSGNRFFHVEGDSWHSWDTPVFKFLLCKRLYMCIIFVLVLLLILKTKYFNKAIKLKKK